MNATCAINTIPHPLEPHSRRRPRSTCRASQCDLVNTLLPVLYDVLVASGLMHSITRSIGELEKLTRMELTLQLHAAGYALAGLRSPDVGRWPYQRHLLHHSRF